MTALYDVFFVLNRCSAGGTIAYIAFVKSRIYHILAHLLIGSPMVYLITAFLEITC